MKIVNGFSCQDCTDVLKAQKGIDPTAGPEARPGETKAHIQAKRLEKSAQADLTAPNQPLTTGPLGTTLNIRL